MEQALSRDYREMRVMISYTLMFRFSGRHYVLSARRAFRPAFSRFRRYVDIRFDILLASGFLSRSAAESRRGPRLCRHAEA